MNYENDTFKGVIFFRKPGLMMVCSRPRLPQGMRDFICPLLRSQRDHIAAAPAAAHLGAQRACLLVRL